MSTATDERLTVEQYLEVTVKGDRKQLVDGRIVVNEPRPLHALAQTRIVAALDEWSRAAPGRGLGCTPTDVIVGPHDMYGPDAIWIAEEHVPEDLSKRLVRIPDLCVEVRSESTWRYDVGRKRTMYEAAGLGELWLVDTDSRSVLVYRRSKPSSPTFDVALELGIDERLTSPLLAGFALPVRWLFER